MEIRQLIEDLASSDIETRRRAAELLSNHPEVAMAALPLVRACGDADETVREWAWAALEQMEEPSGADGPSLAEMLVVSTETDARYWAVTLLGRLGEEAAFAVPMLVKALDGDAAMNVRERAAWALGKIGPRAEAGVESLRRAADSESPRLKRLAETSLRQITGG